MDISKSTLDIIWAPWRLAYVTSDEKEKLEQKKRLAQGLVFMENADPDCFICQGSVCSEDQFSERYILHRTDHIIALLNRYPYNNGHLLIAPKRHIARLDLLTGEEWSEITSELTFWTGKLTELMNPDGFNIGLNLGRSAGAGLPGHLHWHIVPRWNGDTNFITTIGSAKAIPQSLEALWGVLKK
ncbi:MAG: HIT domain-containing protein [Planctomycetia bacterium]|nr:HIT domain-containing protein [Planctomycetia bacterium]